MRYKLYRINVYVGLEQYCVYDLKLQPLEDSRTIYFDKDVHFALKIMNVLRQVMIRLGHVINVKK
jgi:hypothetical protein